MSASGLTGKRGQYAPDRLAWVRQGRLTGKRMHPLKFETSEPGGDVGRASEQKSVDDEVYISV